MDKLDILDGIDTKSFASIIADKTSTKLLQAELEIVPVLPDMPLTEKQLTQIGLSFLHETDDKPLPGAIISLSPEEWVLCKEFTPVALLDPAGNNGNMLIFAHPGTKGILTYSKKTDLVTVISTDDKGVPFKEELTRGALLRTALPESEQVCRSPAGNSLSTSHRKIARAASGKVGRKGRTSASNA